MILDELVDLRGPLGIAYRRRADGPYPELTHAHPFAFFPRLSSRFSVKAPRGAAGTMLDTYAVVLVPGNATLALTGDSAIADGVAFFPSPSLVEAVGTEYKIPVAARLGAVPDVAVLPRTNWLNEVMHRYVFERVVAHNSGNKATEFLEAEIVKELHYRLAELRSGPDRVGGEAFGAGRHPDVLMRALDVIESNLFHPIAVSEIAARAGVSESTLLREFQKGLKKSPLAYLIDRRLEEAMVLLKSRRYGVGQVSDMVGYENVSAFSAAFKRHFGVSPSRVADA